MAGNSVAGFAEQTIDLLPEFTTAQLDSQELVAVFGGRVRSAAEMPRDQGQVTLKFFDENTVLLREVTVAAQNVADRWELVGGRVQVPVGTRRIGYRFDATRSTGTTNDSFVDGEFDWIPQTSGIDFGTFGLRIQVSLAGNSMVLDRGTENFTVPENTTTFFVNDRDGSAAPGDNRNTGKLAAAPKPYPNNVLRIYSLGPTHTLQVDAGDYPIFGTLVIANSAGLGDDEGFVLAGASAGCLPEASGPGHATYPCFGAEMGGSWE